MTTSTDAAYEAARSQWRSTFAKSEMSQRATAAAVSAADQRTSVFTAARPVNLAGVQVTESSARSQILLEWDEIWWRFDGRRRAILQREAETREAFASKIRSANVRLDARRADADFAEAEHHNAALAQGRADLAIEREHEKQWEARLKVRRAQMREDMVSVTAALAFVAGEQSRGRLALEEADRKFRQKMKIDRRADAKHAVELEAQRAIDEVEEERKQEAEAEAQRKRQQAKHQADIRKEQAKLIAKCTHARNGGSVFVGNYGKKLCLMCRVRLDAATGLYVSMDTKDGTKDRRTSR